MGVQDGGRLAFGVDVGGSGIKGGIVDLATGTRISPRHKLATPAPATPAAVATTVAQVVAEARWEGDIGVTLPSVIKSQVAKTAANIDPTWIDVDTTALFAEALPGRTVTVLNDADAAGFAEDRYGAAADIEGVVILLTFGTGIGSAILQKGVLLPNTEFGHFEIGGIEAEKWAAASVKTAEDLDWAEWTRRVSAVLGHLEALLWPDIFIAGGGISREHERWIPLLTNRTPVIPARLRNDAGIVGAAYAAAHGVRP